MREYLVNDRLGHVVRVRPRDRRLQLPIVDQVRPAAVLNREQDVALDRVLHAVADLRAQSRGAGGAFLHEYRVSDITAECAHAFSRCASIFFSFTQRVCAVTVRHCTRSGSTVPSAGSRSRARTPQEDARTRAMIASTLRRVCVLETLDSIGKLRRIAEQVPLTAFRSYRSPRRAI
jgi:hypothetical protein